MKDLHGVFFLTAPTFFNSPSNQRTGGLKADGNMAEDMGNSCGSSQGQAANSAATGVHVMDIYSLPLAHVTAGITGWFWYPTLRC